MHDRRTIQASHGNRLGVGLAAVDPSGHNRAMADDPPPSRARSRDRGPLPSHDGATLSVGTFLAGLEQKILHDRPPPAAIVEEEARSNPLAAHGLIVEMPEPEERPEPPDSTGAVL